jgi:hypothetical protein
MAFTVMGTGNLSMMSGTAMSETEEVCPPGKKKKAPSVIEYFREEFDLEKAKMAVGKLAKSAGITLRSYDLDEIEENLCSQGLIPTDEAAALVRSVLLEEGYRAEGSAETVHLRREEEMAPFIHRRRIWWEPVAEASGYGVYVSKDRTLLEPGRFSWEKTPGIISRMVTGKTELILPEEWPEFPTEPGTYHIGITSRDDLGNESDPLLLSGPFKFLAPPSPSRGGIDYL